MAKSEEINAESQAPYLAVIIPTFNEERSIGGTLTECYESLKGLKFVVIVVDDGSSDGTAKTARECGAIVVSHRNNRGVAKAVQTGLTEALRHRPKIIIQLDGDGQHDPEDITRIIRPIADGSADLVIGRRVHDGWKPPTSRRFGNWILTRVTNYMARTNLNDSQSGFRAMTPEVASELSLTSRNTYVGEMIIRASREGFRIAEIDVKVAPRRHGRSRAVRNVFAYALGAMVTMIRVYRDYEPLRFFGGTGVVFVMIGLILGLLLILPTRVFSLLEGVIGFRTVFLFITVGIQIILFGFLADMLGER